MNILGDKTKKLGIDRTCDNGLKPGFYFIPIGGNKKINRKAKPSVRVGQKATDMLGNGIRASIRADARVQGDSTVCHAAEAMLSTKYAGGKHYART